MDSQIKEINDKISALGNLKTTWSEDGVAFKKALSNDSNKAGEEL